MTILVTRPFGIGSASGGELPAPDQVRAEVWVSEQDYGSPATEAVYPNANQKLFEWTGTPGVDYPLSRGRAGFFLQGGNIGGTVGVHVGNFQISNTPNPFIDTFAGTGGLQLDSYNSDYIQEKNNPADNLYVAKSYGGIYQTGGNTASHYAWGTYAPDPGSDMYWVSGDIMNANDDYSAAIASRLPLDASPLVTHHLPAPEQRIWVRYRATLYWEFVVVVGGATVYSDTSSLVSSPFTNIDVGHYRRAEIRQYPIYF